MKGEYRKKWIVTPETLPGVVRRCPKCGRKTRFDNSGKFRVNANGGLLDVWLIYRCSRCEAAWKLSVYQRVEVSALDRREYLGFMENDPGLARRYASQGELFAENRAQRAGGTKDFRVQILDTTELCQSREWEEAQIEMRGQERLRIDVLFAREMNLTRNQVKALCQKGLIRDGRGMVKAGDRVRDGQVFYLKKDMELQRGQKTIVKKCI